MELQGRNILKLQQIIQKWLFKQHKVEKSGKRRGINLAELDWKIDCYWGDSTPLFDPDGDEHGALAKYHNSISNIAVENDCIKMVGNPVKPGKGAAWATVETGRINSIEFDYDVIRR